MPNHLGVMARKEKRPESPERRAARPQVLILDNDGFVRDALVRRLTDLGFWPLEAVTLEEAERKAGNKPVAALVDLSLEGSQTDSLGLNAAKIIKSVSPDTLCMVITDCSAEALPRMVRLAMHAPESERFDGFVRKEGPAHIIDAFQRLMDDKYYLEPSLGKYVYADDHATLTEGEIEVVALLDDGLHYKEIGDRLHLTDEAVKKRVGSAKKKLNVRGSGLAGLVRAASDAGYMRARTSAPRN